MSAPIWYHCSIKDGSIIGVSPFDQFRGDDIKPKFKRFCFHVKVNVDWNDRDNYRGRVYEADGITVKHEYKFYFDLDTFFTAAEKAKIIDNDEIVEVDFTLYEPSIIKVRT